MNCVRTTIVHTGDGCLGLKVEMGVHFAARCAQDSIGGSFYVARSVMYIFVQTVDVIAYVERNALCSTTDLISKLVSGE